MAPGGESEAHWRLKQLSLSWAAARGYAVRACEIRLPHSGYRGDVVAYRPSGPAGRTAALGETAIFECKQSRADFLKDAQSAEASLERLQQLRRRLERLEDLLGIHYPSLRQGDSLFPEFESVACHTLDHRTWKRVSREIRVLENRVNGKTKFEKLVRYRSANRFYLVMTEGLARLDEVPSAWGVLECPRCDMEGKGESEVELRVVRAARFIDAEERTRLDLLQRVASSVSSRLHRQLGMEGDPFEAVGEEGAS